MTVTTIGYTRVQCLSIRVRFHAAPKITRGKTASFEPDLVRWHGHDWPISIGDQDQRQRKENLLARDGDCFEKQYSLAKESISLIVLPFRPFKEFSPFRSLPMIQF